MFILVVFSWRRRPACSLLAACMQGVDAGVQGVDPGMRRRRAHGVDAGNVHVYFNGGGYTWSVMQPACILHAGCMQDAATCNLLHTIVCRLHAACMQPACISSVALALHYMEGFLNSQLDSCWPDTWTFFFSSIHSHTLQIHALHLFPQLFHPKILCCCSINRIICTRQLSRYIR